MHQRKERIPGILRSKRKNMLQIVFPIVGEPRKSGDIWHLFCFSFESLSNLVKYWNKLERVKCSKTVCLFFHKTRSVPEEQDINTIGKTKTDLGSLLFPITCLQPSSLLLLPEHFYSCQIWYERTFRNQDLGILHRIHTYIQFNLNFRLLSGLPKGG